MPAKKGKGIRGRPRKAKSRAAIHYRRRNGFWPNGAAPADQLSAIIRDQGTLPPNLRDLADQLLHVCTEPYQNTVALKEDGAVAFEIFGSPGHAILEKLVSELTNMEIYAPEPEDRPWLLKTRGECDPHWDKSRKGVFTLLICLETAQPYRMAISYRRVSRNGEEPSESQYREVELTKYSYLVFPSCMIHKCIAEECNTRAIVNTLLRARPRAN